MLVNGMLLWRQRLQRSHWVKCGPIGRFSPSKTCWPMRKETTHRTHRPEKRHVNKKAASHVQTSTLDFFRTMRSSFLASCYSSVRQPIHINQRPGVNTLVKEQMKHGPPEKMRWEGWARCPVTPPRCNVHTNHDSTPEASQGKYTQNSQTSIFQNYQSHKCQWCTEAWWCVYPLFEQSRGEATVLSGEAWSLRTNPRCALFNIHENI